ncbi:hypothetical protein BY996DRAFT_6418060 [Phakopsora pachyrhizi]|nr:hypothetical protein BY996DRAFT_6418060 [Phakopsora pachyrhizi]
MTHCVQIFGVPVGTPNTQVTATHGAKNADSRVSSQATATLKPADVLESLAVILVYSMSEDGDSNSPECRALSAASKLLTAMETFFHPSNHALTAVTPTMLKKQSYPAGAANFPQS